MSGDATEAMVAKGIGVGSESFDLLVGDGCTVEVGSGYWTVSATVGTGDGSGVLLCTGSEPELHRLELLVALSYAMAASAKRTVSVNDEKVAYFDLLDTLLLKHNYNPVEMDDSDTVSYTHLRAHET